MVPLLGVVSSLHRRRCSSIVAVMLVTGLDKLGSVASQRSDGVFFVVNVDASVPLHQQSLAFLSASLNYTRGARSVAIAMDRRCGVHLVDIVLRAGTSQLVCDLTQLALVTPIRRVDLVQTRLDKPGATPVAWG